MDTVHHRMFGMGKGFSGTSIFSRKKAKTDVESGRKSSMVASQMASAMMMHATSVASAAGLDSEHVSFQEEYNYVIV